MNKVLGGSKIVCREKPLGGKGVAELKEYWEDVGKKERPKVVEKASGGKKRVKGTRGEFLQGNKEREVEKVKECITVRTRSGAEVKVTWEVAYSDHYQWYSME